MSGWCCMQFFSTRAYLLSIGAAFTIDLLASASVFLLGRSSSVEERDPSRYDSSTSDTLVSCLARIAILPLLSSLALLVHRRTAASSALLGAKESESASVVTGSSSSTSSSRQMHDGTLISTDMGIPLRTAEAAVCRAPDELSSSASAPLPFEVQREHALVMKKAARRRSVIMAFAFVTCTVMSMYNGLKCVGFHYDPRVIVPQGVLFASILLLINLEYFLIHGLIDRLTEEQGELVPHLHMHPLFFEVGLKCYQCSVCHERTKGPHYAAYHCTSCDFILCVSCHKKKDDPRAKGYGARAVRREGEQLTTWTYFVRIFRMTMKFWPTTTVALACLLATQGMQIWAPSVQGSIFDGIIKYMQDPGDGRAAFERAMLLYLLINVLQGLFGGLRSLAQELVMRQLSCQVRSELFESVVRMDISFFDTMHTGQLTSRMTNDAGQMVQPLNTLLNNLVGNLLLLVGGMFMAFRTSWRLSILALTVVPPITYCYRRYAEWGRKVNRSIWCAYAEGNSSATEAIHNIRTVRGFSTERHETQTYQDSINEALRHGKRGAYMGASVTACSTYLNLGTAVLILWYGGTLVCDSHGESMGIGSLITFQLYWNMMNNAFISLGNVFNDLIRSASAAERVISLIDARPEVDPDEGEPLERQGMRGHLRLRGVQFRYKTRPENLVLKGIDLDMPPGTTTALVGKSGGGKSTLVHLLMRFYEPTDGEILLDGRDIRQLSSKSVRATCGFVAQDTQLFAKSIEENLAYGLDRDYTHEELVEACKAANAHDFIMEAEEQYATRVGERGMMLSGGQRQRLAIARCFLRKPRLLFLDEATSALDAENEATVQGSLDSLIEQTGCTVVLIAHRLSTVINATQIAVVHKGSIFERGTHDELVDRGGVYAQLVKRQMAQDASSVLDGKVEKQGVSNGKKALQAEIDDLIAEMEASGDMSAGNASGK